MDEERGKQVAKLLFINVPEVKIEIGHGCPPSVAQGHDILYDRGAGSIMSVSQGRMRRRTANQITLFPEPAIETGNDEGLLHREGQQE